MAAELGLDRPAKSNLLDKLEGRGLVTVVREGNRFPVVTVRRLNRTG
jgi:DNA-binding MarR family transcriptional regulator